MTTRTGRLSGRKAQAARNDEVILAAARTVFIRDPTAPIAAVANEAGVGISALYRRYESKEQLLQSLCSDGLRRFIQIAERALVDDGDPWETFAGFIRGIIDADVHSLTVHLAGTFTPTEQMERLADEANSLLARLFRRTKVAGAIRTDLQLNDVAMIFEQMAAIRLGDAERTRSLRRRYLTLQLDALRPHVAAARLPGTPPTSAELGQRWVPK